MFLVWSHLHTRSGVSFSAVAELEKPSIIINHDWEILGYNAEITFIYHSCKFCNLLCKKESLRRIYLCMYCQKTHIRNILSVGRPCFDMNRHDSCRL